MARRLLLAVAVLATAVCLVLAFRGLDWGAAWDALRSCDFKWLIPAFVLFCGTILVRAVRWRYLFLPERRPPMTAVMRATLLGYLYLSVLPVRAGEPARILLLNRLAGTPKVEIAGTAVVERVFDLAVLLTCFFALSPWLPTGSWAHPLAILAGIAGLLIGAVVVTLRLTGDRGLRVLLRPFGLLPRVGRDAAEEAATSLRHGLAGLHDASTALLALGFTLVSWLLLGAACAVALRAFDLGVSPLAGMLVVIAVSLGASLPSLPGGVGIFEAASIAALSAYGISHADALAFGLVWHALNLVPFLILGPPLALLVGRRARRDPPGPTL
jgi:uncharacterized protein (TIRG00374 family)